MGFFSDAIRYKQEVLKYKMAVQRQKQEELERLKSPITPQEAQTVKSILPDLPGRPGVMTPGRQDITPELGVEEVAGVKTTRFGPTFSANLPREFTPTRESVGRELAFQKQLGFPALKDKRSETFLNVAEQNPAFRKILEAASGGSGDLSAGAKNLVEFFPEEARKVMDLATKAGLVTGMTEKTRRALGFETSKPTDYEVWERVNTKTGQILEREEFRKDEPPGATGDPKEQWRLVKRGGSDISVNVQTGQATKTMATQLQADIKGAARTIDDMNSIMADFDEDFLNLWGQAAAFGVKKGERIKLDKLTQLIWPEETEKAKMFSRKYTQFKKSVDQKMLKWRHEITGVAGGEKEMQFIQNAFINMSESPSTFIATAAQLIKAARAMMRRAQWFQAKGFVHEGMSREALQDLYATSPWENWTHEGAETTGPEVSPEQAETSKRNDAAERARKLRDRGGR